MMKSIIDLQLGAQRIGKDERSAKALLDLLLNHIHEDQKNISNALKKNNLKKLYETNHKLLGALAYCGAPRLEFSCQQLQSALKNVNKKNVNHYAQAVLSEIVALRELQE